MGQNLKEKIAYITGASSGIGRATAMALAKEGVHVGLIARTESKLVKVAKEARAHGVNAHFAVADISNAKEVDQAITELGHELGSADILVNDAAVMPHGTFMDMAPEEWKHTIEINVFGTYHVTRAVLPQMIKKDRGDIINISSSNGLKADPGSSAYSASKFAVQGMSEALMQEVRRNNIRVFTLNPSYVASDQASDGDPDKQDKEKFIQPEDLAEYMVSQLKLHPRIFIKQSLQWATNPF